MGSPEETAMTTTRLVVVTGATGYVGGRLVPRLLEAGRDVRCVVRDAEKLADRPWRNDVEVVEADLSVPTRRQMPLAEHRPPTTSFIR